MARGKRKLEDLHPTSSGEEDLLMKDDTELSLALGNDLTWRSLQDEVRNHRVATFRKYFADLSDYEAEIKRRILSYEIELTESNYLWVAERLRRDEYPALVYKNEWEDNFYSGIKYKDSHSFIEIESKRGDEKSEKKLIVDLDFQSQFALSLPSPTYLNLWDSLPKIFVGTEEKLRRIIAIICSAAQQPIPEYIKQHFLVFK